MKSSLIFTFLLIAPFTLPAETSSPNTTDSNLAPIGTTSSPRTINFKATIDGEEDIIIQNGKLYIQHIGWEKLTNITINGRKWAPIWNENMTDDFLEFRPLLAPFPDTPVNVKLVKGRCSIKAVQQPSKTNEDKLVIRIHDDPGGVDQYYIRIFW